MTMSLYPKSPEQVPRDLLALPGSYKLRTAAVLISIFLFILLYLLMVYASGYYVYYAFTYEMGRVNKLTLLLKGGAIATSLMLLFFMVKFLFKRQLHDESRYIEIDPHRHPDLRDFIRHLCAETGAPEPHKIFVSSEINAAVFYNSTILSLFLPTKKNLLIGLGLVNSLTLAEFKAVLAHEFGHFSQKSMKLGSYVYMANRIIYDMVYNRDKWDDVLSQWSKLDFRIAVFAWILIGVVWVLRGMLRLLYSAINLLHASLSRQMEFNADLVAVSVTGSDAIISGLARLTPSSEALSKTFSYAAAAADHKMFSRDLFYHHTKMLEKHTAGKSEITTGTSEVAGVSYLFNERDAHAADMYASHPCNYDRERNAKKTYIKGSADNRSPWLLFRNPEQLRFQVTEQLYRLNTAVPEKVEWLPPEKVEAFIETEMAETSYDPVYKGAYDDRYLTEFDPADPAAVCAEAGVNKEDVSALRDLLWGAELQTEMDALAKKREEMAKIYRAVSESKPDKITIDGNPCTKDKAIERYDAASKEYDDLFGWFTLFDKKVFAVHYLLAEERSANMAAELKTRYTFHFKIQNYLKRAQTVERDMENLFEQLNAKREFSEEDLAVFRNNFQTIHAQFAALRSEANAATLVPLTHMEQYVFLGDFLFTDTVMPGTDLDGDSLRGLSNINGTTLFRLRRIFYKSLKAILSLQENIRLL